MADYNADSDEGCVELEEDQRVFAPSCMFVIKDMNVVCSKRSRTTHLVERLVAIFQVQWYASFHRVRRNTKSMNISFAIHDRLKV